MDAKIRTRMLCPSEIGHFVRGGCLIESGCTVKLAVIVTSFCGVLRMPLAHPLPDLLDQPLLLVLD